MYEYNAKLSKVIDGDTIDADIDLGFQTFVKQRIKLYGVDTPQSRSKVATEKEEGIKAKNKLIELLPRDFKVRTVLNRRGKFGRVLGELWINCTEDGHEFGGWTNINQWLCENGYAVNYTGQNKADVADEHRANRVYLAEQGIQPVLQWDED